MYWLTTICCAAWAALEKFIATFQHTSYFMFWTLIAFSFFFWIVTFGCWVEDTRKGKGDNPF